MCKYSATSSCVKLLSSRRSLMRITPSLKYSYKNNTISRFEILTFISKCDIIIHGCSFKSVLQGRCIMKSILEELWYGNVCPSDGYHEVSNRGRVLMGNLADCHDNLHATLSDEQKQLLEKFDDCYAELTDIHEREIFVYAFRLGARIAIEIMKDGIE